MRQHRGGTPQGDKPAAQSKAMVHGFYVVHRDFSPIGNEDLTYFCSTFNFSLNSIAKW